MAAPDTIGAILDRIASADPSRPAITEDGVTLDYAGLAGRAAGMATQLASVGVERGSRVALWLPNGILYATAIAAVARLGAAAVHVNTRSRASEVGDLIARTAAAVLVTRADFAAVDFMAILAAIPAEKLVSLKAVMCDAAPAICGLVLVPVTFDGAAPPDAAIRADDALIYATGGTTAKPKLVVHTQGSIADHAHAVADRTATGAPDAASLIAVPFCGTFGNIALMSAIAGGAHVVTMAAFDGEEAAALIRAHAITHLVGDDRLVARLCDAAERSGGRFETVRFTAVAGYRSDAAAAFARGVDFGLRPHAIYGSSEVQALCCVGQPENGGRGEVKPTDPRTRFAIGEGEDLFLAGPSVFDRYLDDPDATTRAFEGGMFATGDRARTAGDGFVFEGRIGDVLRLGGFLVGPAEIESFLESRPGVAGAQVVGVEKDGGPVAIAFVVAADDATIDEAALLADCRRSLARYKSPARIVVVDAFPTSNGPNGPKIARAELRVMGQAIVAAPDPSKRMRTA